MKEIKTPAEFKKQLASEFDCSEQTVYMSLKGYSRSQKSVAIRHRARQLLIEEAKKV